MLKPKDDSEDEDLIETSDSWIEFIIIGLICFIIGIGIIWSLR